MKLSISIQIKAALLLVVFSFNTIIGIACDLGVGMGFNTNHHDDEAEETTVLVHADGKNHQHHDETIRHNHNSKEQSEKGGCCNDGIIKFQSLDKSLSTNGNVVINTPVFVTILGSYFGIDIFRQPQVFNQKYVLDFFHPPPRDIRILIQSFLI